MTSLATAFVTIRPDTVGFGTRLSKTVGSSADKAGKDAGKRMSSGFSTAAKGMAASFAGLFAVGKGVSFLKDSVAEAREAQKVGAQTAAVLKSTGGAAKVSAKQIGDLATSISNKTGIDDEQIQSAENVLLTFKDVRNEVGKGNAIFSQATGVITDMSKALGVDMKGASIQVGKALNDPVKGIAALSRVGVSFTKQQKAQITALVEGGNANALVAVGLATDTKAWTDTVKKFDGDTSKAYADVTSHMSKAQKKQFDYYAEGGHQIEAQKKILKELNSEFQGSAAAQATAGEKAAVAWGNLKEQIGTALLPVIDKVATIFSTKVVPAISTFITGMQQGTGAGGKFAGIFGKVKSVVTAVIGFLVDNKEAVGAFATVILTVVAAVKVWTAVQTLLNLVLTANPLGLIVVAIAGFVAGLVYAYKHSETFRKIVQGAWAGIQKGVSFAWHHVIEPIFKLLKWYFVDVLFGAAKKLARGMADAWQNIKDKTRSAVLFVADKALWMAEKLLGVFAKLPGKLGAPFRSALDKVKAFRKGVNAEMDAIRDEDVRISLTTVRSTTAHNAARLGDRTSRGGAGPIPGAPMRSAMGGMGIIPKVSGNLAGARAAAASTAQTRDEIAQQAAKAIQDDLKAAHAKALRNAAGASGPNGRPGKVLPAGSYRIGMPYHGYPGHNGADYPAATGTPVSAPWPGRVVTSTDLPGSNPYNNTPYRSYGRYIKIQHANGLSTLYAHLSARGVNAGQSVAAGQFIGRVGMNGNATGPHLHWETARNGVTFNPASLHVMDTGGIMRHGGAAVNLSGRPERILDPRTTRNFERLTYAMDSVASKSGTGNGGTQRIILDAGGGVTFTGYIDSRIQGRAAQSATVRRQTR